MRRWPIAWLAVCFLLFSACGTGQQLVSLQEVSQLVLEQGYTAGQILERLQGASTEQLQKQWGEPDGVLSGMWGDIWRLGEQEERIIIVYYDAEGLAETVIIQEREMQ